MLPRPLPYWGEKAIEAIDDLSWPAANAKHWLQMLLWYSLLGGQHWLVHVPNVGFDLGSLDSSGSSLDGIHEPHPFLWASVGTLNAAMERIDGLTAGMDHDAAPTDDAS